MVYFILGLLPIIWLIVALCLLKMPSHIASVGSLLIGAIEALFIFKLGLLEVLTAGLEGVLMAVWPIIIVIIAAVFTYNLTVYTKAMDTIKKMITSVSDDKRILVILIGWCFGGFLEGMAGFGTAVAIPSSMLMALGFDPIDAILACLVANGMPTMFGSIGIPTVTLASVTNLDAMVLAFIQTLQAAPFLLVAPFIMVLIVTKSFKGLKGMMGFISAASISFVLPEILVAKFAGAELPVVVAAVVSLVVSFVYAMNYSKKHQTPDEYKMAKDENNKKITIKEALVAWAPFILIFVLLLVTSKLVPAVNTSLSAIKSSIYVYSGDAPALITFTWINTPGVLIMLSGIIGGLIQGCSISDLLLVLKNTIIQMYKTMITMLSVLALAKIMGYSGMIGAIAAFLVGSLGTLYPLVSPLIGALGTFVTGSGTSSEVLFGNVQIEAAKAIGASPYWLAAANSLGTGAGKMLAPQSIAIGCAACALNGKDGEILTKIFKYAFIFMIFMAIIVYAGSLFIKF